MTIDWHTGAEGEPATLEYKKVGPAEWEVDIDEYPDTRRFNFDAGN